LVLVTGLAAGVWAFRWAYTEAIEFQDSLLLQIGTLAVRTRFPADQPTLDGVDQDAQVVVEELTTGSKTAPGVFTVAGLPASAPEGLQTLVHGTDQWRVLVQTRPDGSRVAIGQSSDYRDEIARGSAMQTALPIAVLVPCLMLLVGAVIRSSFKPVSRLAIELDAKRSDHLEKLPTDGMPDELLPFIASINRLLDRIATMFNQQRRFIADAAHELRTPITALSLQIENVEHATDSPEVRERLAVLKDGARRSAHLLEQLLTLARYETDAPNMPPVTTLDKVARDVVADVVGRTTQRGIDLGFEQCDAVAVRADVASLGVLMRNLIENAVRHTPDKGRIDLSVRQAGGHALFQVTDTGPGIAESELPRIFEPFFRGTGSIGDGTGLGLSIVQRIAERLGGSVTVENIGRPGAVKGLRANVRLPAAA
jgi:two-component system OmpR family sensor kinase